MNTQRVNVYISGSKITVFYLEQYHEQLKEWLTIGGTYENIEHATAAAELHNMRELYQELTKEQAKHE